MAQLTWYQISLSPKTKKLQVTSNFSFCRYSFWLPPNADLRYSEELLARQHLHAEKSTTSLNYFWIHIWIVNPSAFRYDLNPFFLFGKLESITLNCNVWSIWMRILKKFGHIAKKRGCWPCNHAMTRGKYSPFFAVNKEKWAGTVLSITNEGSN